MADHLVVGLSFWIIQDGNYGDFVQGAHTAFALEAWAAAPLEEFAAGPMIHPSITHRGNASHEAVGQVVYVADDWWAVRRCRPLGRWPGQA